MDRSGWLTASGHCVKAYVTSTGILHWLRMTLVQSITRELNFRQSMCIEFLCLYFLLLFSLSFFSFYLSNSTRLGRFRSAWVSPTLKHIQPFQNSSWMYFYTQKKGNEDDMQIKKYARVRLRNTVYYHCSLGINECQRYRTDTTTTTTLMGALVV